MTDQLHDDELDGRVKRFLEWHAETVAAQARGADVAALDLVRRVSRGHAVAGTRLPRLAWILVVLGLVAAAVVGALVVGSPRPEPVRLPNAVVPSIDVLPPSPALVRLREQGRITDIGGGAATVLATRDAVWVASWATNVVTRIDPATHRVVATVAVGPPPQDGALHDVPLAYDGRDVWVSALGEVVRIDSATNRTTATVRLDAGSLVFGAGSLWTTDLTGIVRIDPARASVTARITLAQSVTGLAFGHGALWASTGEAVGLFGPRRGTGVFRIDPATNSVSGAIDALGGGPIATGEAVVWVVDRDATPSVESSPRETQELVEIDASTLAVVSRTALGDVNPANISADGAWVWLVDSEAMPSLYGFAAAAHGMSTRTLFGTGSGGSGLVVGFGSVWVSTHGSGHVIRFAPPD